MKTCLHILFLCMGIASFAQNEFTKWYFGRYTGLDFMVSPPAVINHTTLNTFEGSASAADGAGNLLFYTDGITVWNKQQLVMANGTGLFGNSSTVQSALIVKQPGNSNIYYVFTLASQGASNGLRYSLVDMNLAAGMGSVTVKNAAVSTPCTEQLSGVRHCNGVDMWIVTHALNNNNFQSFLLTAAGLNPTPVLSGIGPAPPTFTPSNFLYGQGTIKFSPNGKKLGLTFFNGSNNSEVAIFDFDKSTGLVSNYFSLMTSTVNCYGCEFSGDGTKFYAAGFNTSPQGVYQWDLCAGSNQLIIASKTTVGNPAVASGQLQLAPNGKIYIVGWGSQTVSAVNNPDQPGIACNYIPFALSVATGTNGTGLPNFFGGAIKILPSFTYTVNPLISCATASFTAPPNPTVNLGCGALGYPVLGISWNFGQPSTGAANTSTLNNPTHNFGASGTFPVKLIFNYQCGADTVYQNVTITGPTISVASNSCAATATVNIAGAAGPFTYTWIPSGQTTSTANVNTGSYTINVNDAGTNCVYSVTTAITSFPSPTLAVQSVSICPKGKATLTVSGASSYTWSPGGNTGTTYTTAPTATQVYSVTGSFTNGCSSITTASVTVLKCTSIDEDDEDLTILNIYPNPMSDELFVETSEQIDIIIYDLAGQEIIRQRLESGNNKVNAEALKSGIYFLRASGKGGYTMDKIIKLD